MKIKSNSNLGLGIIGILAILLMTGGFLFGQKVERRPFSEMEALAADTVANQNMMRFRVTKYIGFFGMGRPILSCPIHFRPSGEGLLYYGRKRGNYFLQFSEPIQNEEFIRIELRPLIRKPVLFEVHSSFFKNCQLRSYARHRWGLRSLHHCTRSLGWERLE